MKFITYLEKITGVGVYPLTSLLIFVVFFIGLTIWTVKADKGYIQSMSNLPFSDNNNENK